MEDFSNELLSFLDSGIYHFGGANAVFVDPVRLLNTSYTHFRVSSSTYYSRCFEDPRKGSDGNPTILSSSKKNKKRKRISHILNAREMCAENRHQDARPFILSAYRAFQSTMDLLTCLSKLVSGENFMSDEKVAELNFIELGCLWQAPLYQMSLCGQEETIPIEGGMGDCYCGEKKVVPLFNNLIGNEACHDVEAEILNNRYILPGNCCFFMSDLKQIHDLIPAEADNGYNLMIIDPPWENRSVYQKAAYPTLPNKYLLYLPIKQLAHVDGALVVLWITNREKLRVFVEEELFPAWGVTNITQFYWLKVKPDGSLLGELDLFHHRPYECFLLGYINGKAADSEQVPSYKSLHKNKVIISIPGAHSRKPPLGKLLSDHIPGSKPAKCIELFARELAAGWTSWGNEPLHFQDLRYFLKRGMQNCTPLQKSH